MLQPALDIAKHSVIIVVSAEQQHLQLQISVDDNTTPIAQCTSPEKVSCQQPVSQLVNAVQLVAESAPLSKAIDLFMQYSAINFSRHAVKAADIVTLIDYRDSITSSITLPKQLAVMTIAPGNLSAQHSNSLFWPFFDTDLLLLIQDHNAVTPLSVLVADDSIPSKVATQAMLEKLGCIVISASDGLEALAIAQQQAFDLILLDERMPGLNGSDVASQLNQQGQLNCNTPKIALTGITQPDEIDALFRKGITHYLEKPITKLTLEKFLQQWQVTPVHPATR